jgi:hypothetical protein
VTRRLGKVPAGNRAVHHAFSEREVSVAQGTRSKPVRGSPWSRRIREWRRSRAFSLLESTLNWTRHELRARRVAQGSGRWGLWRQGFFAESAILYDFPRNDPREYLSDFQQFRCDAVNADNGLFKYKLRLRALLLAMGFRQADTVACVHGDRVLERPFSGRGRCVSPEVLQARLLEAGGQYVVKPEDGLRGQDLFLLECGEGGLVRQRGPAAEPFDLPAYLKRLHAASASPTLFERRLPQAPFWDALFPGSANTVRVLTLWTPGESRPFVAAAVQRIGTADTVPADHWTGGGVCAPVDPETGRLGAGRQYPIRGGRADPVRSGAVDHHPETGAAIRDAVLPGWPDIRDTVLRAAGSLPFNPMCGWDVMVHESGTPVILEGNGNSGISLLQVHGGLLRDARVREFYAAVGVR